MSATILRFPDLQSKAPMASRQTIHLRAIERSVRAEERVADSRGECSERAERRERWRQAEMRMMFYERLKDLLNIAQPAYEAGVQCAERLADGSREKFFGALEDYRRELAIWLVLPAPTVAALNRKKAERAGRGFEYLPVKAADVDRQIAEDEVWLKANAPVRHRSRVAMAE